MLNIRLRECNLRMRDLKINLICDHILQQLRSYALVIKCRLVVGLFGQCGLLVILVLSFVLGDLISNKR